MTQTLTGRMHAQVHRFNSEVIGLPIPDSPTRLSNERKEWSLTAMREELTEFEDSMTLADEADALIDLTYFALGRLVEMGLPPGPLFDEVHRANMGKVRGELSKRPNSLGHDAVKPDGWTPPDLEPYLAVTSSDLQTLSFLRVLRREAPYMTSDMPFEDDTRSDDVRGPRVLVLGHARHGKDTVCEMLRDEYGLKFESSSRFCARRVLWPVVTNLDVRRDFLQSLTDTDLLQRMTGALADMQAKYNDPEACYEDRGSYREVWFQVISWFNDRPTRLAEAIFEENHVYCGIRNKREFHGVRNSDMVDLVVWVDASDRLPPEDDSSITVAPWMADFVIDNNGTLDDLRRNVEDLMSNFEPLEKEE